MVGLNVAITLAGAKTLRFGAGIAPGLISGTMTDTAVVGVAQGAIDGGAYQPPANVTAGEVSANIAAAYAITYLLALVAIILLVRFLPAVAARSVRPPSTLSPPLIDLRAQRLCRWCSNDLRTGGRTPRRGVRPGAVPGPRRSSTASERAAALAAPGNLVRWRANSNQATCRRTARTPADVLGRRGATASP